MSRITQIFLKKPQMKPTAFSICIVAVAAIVIAGCNGTSTTNSQTSDEQDAVSVTGDHGNHDHDSAGSDMKKMKAALANLSPQDAASVEKQHFCPVGGGMLGTMGTPIKVEVKGESIWICCEDCKQKILDNPDEYLAKLHKE